MRNRKIYFAAAFFIAAAIIIFYSTVDPSTSRWAPKCLFRMLTGWDCPGCGAQRAVYALLHGQWSEAWGYNPFFLIITPIAFALGIIELYREHWPRLYKALYRPPTFILIAAAIMAWTIVRNL